MNRTDTPLRGFKCPVCGSTNFYYRPKTEDFRCRHCGTVFAVVSGKAKLKESPFES